MVTTTNLESESNADAGHLSKAKIEPTVEPFKSIKDGPLTGSAQTLRNLPPLPTSRPTSPVEVGSLKDLPPLPSSPVSVEASQFPATNMHPTASSDEEHFPDPPELQPSYHIEPGSLSLGDLAPLPTSKPINEGSAKNLQLLQSSPRALVDSHPTSTAELGPAALTKEVHGPFLPRPRSGSPIEPDNIRVSSLLSTSLSKLGDLPPLPISKSASLVNSGSFSESLPIPEDDHQTLAPATSSAALVKKGIRPSPRLLSWSSTGVGDLENMPPLPSSSSSVVDELPLLPVSRSTSPTEEGDFKSLPPLPSNSPVLEQEGHQGLASRVTPTASSEGGYFPSLLPSQSGGPIVLRSLANVQALSTSPSPIIRGLNPLGAPRSISTTACNAGDATLVPSSSFAVTKNNLSGNPESLPVTPLKELPDPQSPVSANPIETLSAQPFDRSPSPVPSVDFSRFRTSSFSNTQTPGNSVKRRSWQSGSQSTSSAEFASARSLPSQPASPSMKPIRRQSTPGRTPHNFFASLTKNPSPTAVPLYLRRPSLAPKLHKSALVIVTGPHNSAHSPPTPRMRQSRAGSTESKSSRGLRPLYLVERHGPRQMATAEDTYPPLRLSPSSTSVEDLKGEKLDELYTSSTNQPSDAKEGPFESPELPPRERSTFSSVRDSGVHVYDSPISTYPSPVPDPVRDSGFQDAPPEQLITQSLEDPSLVPSPENPLESRSQLECTIFSDKNSGNTSIDLPTATDILPRKKSRETIETGNSPEATNQLTGLRSTEDQHPAQSFDDSNDDRHDHSDAQISSTRFLEALPIPSPVASASKERDSLLFTSPPAALTQIATSPSRSQVTEGGDDDQANPADSTQLLNTKIATDSHHRTHHSSSPTPSDYLDPFFVDHGSVVSTEEIAHQSIFGGPIGINSDAETVHETFPRPPSRHSRLLDPISEDADNELPTGSRARPKKRSLRRTPESRGHISSPRLLDQDERSLISTDDLIARLSWPPVDDNAETVDIERVKSRSPRASQLSALTPDPNSSRTRRHDRHSPVERRSPSSPPTAAQQQSRPTPESAGSDRPNSRLSQRSGGAPPLRRVDRRLSGDLRAANQREAARVAKQTPQHEQPDRLSPSPTRTSTQHRHSQLDYDTPPSSSAEDGGVLSDRGGPNPPLNRAMAAVYVSRSRS